MAPRQQRQEGHTVPGRLKCSLEFHQLIASSSVRDSSGESVPTVFMGKEIGAENKVFLSKNLRKEEKLAHVSVLKSSQEETKSPRKDMLTVRTTGRCFQPTSKRPASELGVSWWFYDFVSPRRQSTPFSNSGFFFSFVSVEW